MLLKQLFLLASASIVDSFTLYDFIEPLTSHFTSTVSVHLKVTILPSSGSFEITENNAIVVEGKVQPLLEGTPVRSEEHLSPIHHTLTISREDIYKELNIRGYNYEDIYQGLFEANTEGFSGQIEWNGDWTAYIDASLQFRLLSLTHRDLRLPTQIERVVIQPKLHKEISSSGSRES